MKFYWLKKQDHWGPLQLYFSINDRNIDISWYKVLQRVMLSRQLKWSLLFDHC